jgi:arabinogalactan oligomer/maltooligosaccharide transport system permease protein
MNADPKLLTRRLTWGLLTATVAVALLGQWLLRGTFEADRRDRSARLATVTSQALVDVVERAGDDTDLVRRVVAAYAAEHAGVRSIRVVALSGAQLLASTAPDDVGEKAAPRRLAREEKDLFDAAQRLRAAVTTNREEGAARKDELEVTELASGAWRLAVPTVRDGEVSGMVLVESVAPAALARPGWLAALLVVVLPVLAFLALARVAGGRRAVLVALAAVLCVAAVAAFGRHLRTVVAERWRASEAEIAAAVGVERGRTVGLVGSLGLGTEDSVHAARWDADRFRKPFGTITDAGTIDEAAFGRQLAGGAARLIRSMVVIGIVGLALLAFVGLGWTEAVWSTLRRYRLAYAYAAPALIGMLALVFLPFLYGVVLSFTESNIYNSSQPITEIWIGLKNYVDVLGDFAVAKRTPEGVVFNFQNFYWTAGITVVWTIANVAYGVGMGLFLALILNTKGLFARPIYRVLFVLPWAIPNYITALIWKGMFHQQFGVVNQILQIFGAEPVAWFEKTGTSFFACWATNAWLSVPFMMVISLGALQSIAADLYEAARVDGATRWQQFKRITLPSLKPALVPAVILSVIWTFNQFNIIYLVSAGEPAHSTEILITQAYKIAFEQYRYGYAAAYSMVIFAILLAYGMWQNRVTRATEGI